MHLIDCFFGRGEVVHTVGLFEVFFGVLCWLPWLPIAPNLYKWYPVSAPLVSFANENGFAFACYEYVFIFVDSNSFPGEDGYVAIVSCSPDAHE